MPEPEKYKRMSRSQLIALLVEQERAVELFGRAKREKEETAIRLQLRAGIISDKNAAMMLAMLDSRSAPGEWTPCPRCKRNGKWSIYFARCHFCKYIIKRYEGETQESLNRRIIGYTSGVNL